MASSMKNRYKLMTNPNAYSKITCSAYGCDMRSGTNTLSEIKMFAFPRNPFRRRRWELATRRANWKANSKSRLCNKHFVTGKPSKDPKHPDYIPSIFVFNKNAKSKTRGKLSNTKPESCGNSACHNSEGTSVTSSCGIKSFCSKCFSSESVSSAFNQSLAPLNQTLAELMGKLKDMEEEREQLRNELALCRHEIYQLHEAHQHCMVHPKSKNSKPNSSTTSVESKILQSRDSDEPADAYDTDLLPSQYLEQIYREPDKRSKGKRRKKQLKETYSDEEIVDQCPSPKKKKVNNTNLSLELKRTGESPKGRKSSDTASPITIVYLKR